MDKGKKVLEQFWEVFQKKMLLESYIQKSKLKGYYSSEIHCIQYVGNNPDSNVTKLADAFRMTTGGVTKLTKKLVEKKLLETYKNSDNRKEVYFRLTSQGQEVFEIHEKLNEEFERRDSGIFQQITEEEYNYLIHFANEYNKHLDNELQKAGIDLQSGIADRL